MKDQAHLLAVLTTALAAACVGTDASRATTERSSATSSTLDSAVDDDAAAASSATADSEWITERWPELARVASLTAASEIDSARAALSTWAAPGVDVLCVDLTDEQRITVAEHVFALAADLALLEVELSARELRHEVLARVLPEDHPELLAAKYRLANSRNAIGDHQGALALLEHVHAAMERLLPSDDPDLLHAKESLAWTRYVLGDLKGAVVLFECVHAVRERLLPADHPELLAAKRRLAQTRYALGDFAGALALEEDVHAALERSLPADHHELLGEKLILAAKRRELGDTSGARALIEYVHDAYEQLLPADNRELLATKQNLAVVCRELGDFERACALFDHVHEALERLLPSDSPDVLEAKYNLALSRGDLGDFEGALALEEYVHAARERILPDDDPLLLASKQNLAATRYALGDFEGALALFEEVHSARELVLHPEHADLLVAKDNLASVREALGDHDKTLELREYTHSVRVRLLSSGDPELLEAKEMLASSREMHGDYIGALALREFVYAARSKWSSPNDPVLLATELNLARARRITGDEDGALTLLERVNAALQRDRPADDVELLAAKEELASLLNARGDPRRALRLFDEVHDARVRTLSPQHVDLLRAKLHLAMVHGFLGDWSTSKTIAESVLDMQSRLMPPEHPALMQTKVQVAISRLMLHDVDGFCAVTDEVIASLSRLVAPNHLLLMQLKHVRSIVRPMPTDSGMRRAATASMLANQIALSEKLCLHARRATRSVVTRELQLFALSASWSEQLRTEGEAALDVELLETVESLRFAATASIMTSRASGRSAACKAKSDALNRARETLAIRSLIAPEEPEAIDVWRQELLRMAEERDHLEREVRRELVNSGFDVELPTVASIASGLCPSSAYVGLLRYKRITQFDSQFQALGLYIGATEELVAFVVTHDAQVLRIELGGVAPLETAVEEWRRSIGSAIAARSPDFVETGDPSDTAAEAGEQLRKLVLDPILSAVPEVTTLRIVPDDMLFLIPFDALPLGQGVVGDRYTIHVGTHARQFDASDRDEAGTPRLLVIGDVDYGGDGEGLADTTDSGVTLPLDPATRSLAGAVFTPLAGAAREALNVAESFREAGDIEPVVLAGAEATKAAFAANAVESQFLHLATHGWFAPESAAVSMLDRANEDFDDLLRLSIDRAQDTIVGFMPETLCGLALTGANNGPDGILTAEELGTLDLTKCELAVLSACETNVGIHRAGQGIQSLQSSLHAAGVRTAITSLWKVDDEATRKLFESFYTKLWVEKLGPADALWQAKCELRAAGHPVRDWAGWVLTGDPD